MILAAIVGTWLVSPPLVAYAAVANPAASSAPPADADWFTGAYVNGFVSGESIVAHASGNLSKGGEALEKRILVVEPEFARLLTVNARDSSTASHIIRQAWDDGRLQLRRSKEKLIAEGAHISILAHITSDELQASSRRPKSRAASRTDFCLFASGGSQNRPAGGS